MAAQLWLGNTDLFNDEMHVLNIIKQKTGVMGTNCWFAKNRQTNELVGYGFLEFKTTKDAATVLRMLRDTPLPVDPKLSWRLNWGSIKKPGQNFEAMTQSTGYSAYVGNLPIKFEENEIIDHFKRNFPNLLNFRLIHGPDGISKGYGFAKFNTYQDMNAFINKFNNLTDLGKPLKVSEATCNRKLTGPEKSSNSENTTLFVHNFDPEIVDLDILRQSFEQFGNIVRMKMIPNHPDWANIQMETHDQADNAMLQLKNTRFGGTTKVIIEFGRWIDEEAEETTVKQTKVPVIKPPKVSKKQKAEFTSDENLQVVKNTMNLFRQYQCQTPLENTIPSVTNRGYSHSRLQFSSSLFKWNNTQSTFTEKDDPFVDFCA